MSRDTEFGFDIPKALRQLVEAIDQAEPYELDSARALCEIAAGAADDGIPASRRATFKRLAQVLREEMKL